jgi:membrane protease YdiL (CAAX protease family)
VAWRTRRVNLPKQAVVLGTALSWYVGIVLLNGDMAFTIINVVSHGLPYVALVWIVDRRRRAMPFFLPIFLATLLALAFFEEGLWDGLLWREHPGIFGLFAGLPRIGDPATLAWLVPLLALPQSTHYVLDGFIWRTKEVA